MLTCSCGGWLVKAEFDFSEDESFYLEDYSFYVNMKCEECDKEYSVEAKPTFLLSDDEEREIAFHRFK